MLILTRERDQDILIGSNIIVRVVDIRGDKVRIGIDAPREIPVHRTEVARRIAAGKIGLALAIEKERDAVKAAQAAICNGEQL